MVLLCCLDVASFFFFSNNENSWVLCEQEESAGFLSLTRVMSLDKYVFISLARFN